jgi:hypothetical protein
LGAGLLFGITGISGLNAGFELSLDNATHDDDDDDV